MLTLKYLLGPKQIASNITPGNNGVKQLQRYRRNALATGYVVGCVYLTHNNVVVYTGNWQGAINYVKGVK
jgi:hypothetical protein